MKVSPWMLAVALQLVIVVMLFTGSGWSHTAAAPATQVTGTGQRIHVERALSLVEARVIIDAAMAYVRSQNGDAAIAVVDEHGNLISMDRTDGTNQFYGRFAVGKAVGAVALQQSTSISTAQYNENPQRFLSALSMLQGEVILIRGGEPLTVGSRIIGGVGSAGFGPTGDEPAIAAGIEAWERYRASR